jgi:hypothetical protein
MAEANLFRGTLGTIVTYSLQIPHVFEANLMNSQLQKLTQNLIKFFTHLLYVFGLQK